MAREGRAAAARANSPARWRSLRRRRTHPESPSRAAATTSRCCGVEQRPPGAPRPCKGAGRLSTVAPPLRRAPSASQTPAHLGDGLLAATAADTDAVDDVALLGLVAEAASLVGAAGARQAHKRGELTVLPGPHALKVTQHIGLLLLPELRDVLRENKGGVRDAVEREGGGARTTMPRAMATRSALSATTADVLGTICVRTDLVGTHLAVPLLAGREGDAGAVRRLMGAPQTPGAPASRAIDFRAKNARVAAARARQGWGGWGGLARGREGGMGAYGGERGRPDLPMHLRRTWALGRTGGEAHQRRRVKGGARYARPGRLESSAARSGRASGGGKKD